MLCRGGPQKVTTIMNTRAIGRLGLGLAAMLAGCAAPPPPPPPPTVLNVNLRALAGVNPGIDGQAAPVVLRVYQLATAANFSNADFYALYNNDSTVLGQDVVQREDVLLAPGATKSETIRPKDQVKSLAVFAGLRDFQHTIWRGSIDVPPNQTTTVNIAAGPSGVTIAAATPPPAPPPGH